jgi:hypothetical protein
MMRRSTTVSSCLFLFTGFIASPLFSRISSTASVPNLKRLAIPALFLHSGDLGKGTSGLVLTGRDASFLFHEGGVTIRFSDGTNDAELEIVGADRQVIPVGEERSPTRIIRFDSRGGTELSAFTRAVYHDVTPGVDLVFSGNGNRLEAEFIVHSGTPAVLPRLAWKGVPPSGKRTGIKPTGRDDSEPGEKESPPRPRASGESYEIAYCGYLPSLGPRDSGDGIAADSQGCLYVAGSAGTYNGKYYWEDVHLKGWLAKVKADGMALDYIALFDSSIYIADVAVNSSGCAYIVGTATSPDKLPVTIGPDLIHNGGYDAFVAKLNPSGSELLFCGYIGGSGWDAGGAIALDNQENIFVCGGTNSRPDTFPVRGGPKVTWTGGNYPYEEAWIAEVKADGSDLQFCGYIGLDYQGGSGEDIAVDGNGDAYLCGQNTEDGWWAKVRGDSGKLVFWRELSQEISADGICVDALGCVYLTGGSYWNVGAPYVAKYRGGDAPQIEYEYEFVKDEFAEFTNGVAVDSAGRAWVCGNYFSGKNMNSRIACMNADGSGPEFFFDVAGDEYDGILNIAVDGRDNVYAVGLTASAEDSFPVKTGPGLIFDRAADNARDAFVLKLSQPLSLFLQGTRKESRAWMVRRDYAELRLVITNPSGASVTRYALQRKEGGGDYVQIQVIAAANISGGAHDLLDLTLSRSGSSAYRVVAYNGSGKELAVSNQVVL